MNSDQLAEIRPALREVFKAGPNSCVTLEAEGDQEKWLQVVDHSINAAYPHADAPEPRMKALPEVSGLKITGWEAEKFVTLEFPDRDARSIAEWIDAYFIAVLGCKAGDYHVDITYQILK